MRSPLAGVLTIGLSTPCQSMPICLIPKSSWALTLKLKSSVSSTTFWRGRSSQAIDGASSSRPVIESTNGSLPARPNRSCQRNSSLREPSTLAGGLVTVAPPGSTRLAVDLCRLQLAAGRGRERRHAAQHERDRAAAHVFPLDLGTAEIIRQRHRRDDRGQLGPQGRLDAHALDRVADLDVQPARIDLRRQLELVAAVTQLRDDRMLRGKLRDPLAADARPCYS